MTLWDGADRRDGLPASTRVPILLTHYVLGLLLSQGCCPALHQWRPRDHKVRISLFVKEATFVVACVAQQTSANVPHLCCHCSCLCRSSCLRVRLPLAPLPAAPPAKVVCGLSVEDKSDLHVLTSAGVLVRARVPCPCAHLPPASTTPSAQGRAAAHSLG